MVDELMRLINEWYEGDGREAEKLDELEAQLRSWERAGRIRGC